MALSCPLSAMALSCPLSAMALSCPLSVLLEELRYFGGRSFPGTGSVGSVPCLHDDAFPEAHHVVILPMRTTF
eukprot:4298362-Amphidinium_carterae.1